MPLYPSVNLIMQVRDSLNTRQQLFFYLAGLFVITIIIVAIGVSIVSAVKAGESDNTSYAYNVSAKGEEGIYKLATYFPTIGLVLAAVVVIVLLVRAFSKGGA